MFTTVMILTNEPAPSALTITTLPVEKSTGCRVPGKRITIMASSVWTKFMAIAFTSFQMAATILPASVFYKGNNQSAYSAYFMMNISDL